MGISEIKITRLSYRKIQLDYNVPVYMVNYNGDRIKGDVIRISIRYEKTKGKLNYFLLRKSANIPIEKLHFKYKVGSHIQRGSNYHINNISANYLASIKIDFEGLKINLVEFVDSYIVTDRNYINIVRDKKLEDIFS